MIPSSNVWKWPIIRSMVDRSNKSVLYSMNPTSLCSRSPKESVRSNLEVPVFIPTGADLTSRNLQDWIQYVLENKHYLKQRVTT